MRSGSWFQTFSQFSIQATRSIESTMEEANYYAQSKVNDLLTGIDQSMDYLYDYSAGDYGALYKLLEDNSVSRNERQMYVGRMLDRFIQSNQAVSAAWFISARGETFCRFYGQQKTQRAGADTRHSRVLWLSRTKCWTTWTRCWTTWPPCTGATGWRPTTGP